MRMSIKNDPPVSHCSGMEIATLYIQPRHQGKGIGTRLLNASLDFARSQGATSVWLTANVENTQANEFYLAQGFKQVGEYDYPIGDKAYLNHVYSHQLD